MKKTARGSALENVLDISSHLLSQFFKNNC
jgi:hypothetical protein